MKISKNKMVMYLVLSMLLIGTITISAVGYITNVKNEEENKVYLEYPAQVYEDDTVIFEYYILEKASDGIDVYYSPSSFDEAELLYHAVREN